MEDGGSSLFAPDFLTPSQFADLRRADNDPIKNLMLAILKISLEDAAGARCKANGRKRRWNALRSPRARARADAQRSQRARERAAEAIDWIFGDGDGPFSFRTCCETLEIDGAKLRERLRERRPAERQAA